MRKALALLVDRESIQKFIYGRAGRVTANFLNKPEKFVSKNTTWEFNVDKAAKLLDEAGWKPGADGIREKDGKKLKFLYQTSINGPRQKTQAIVKQACQKAGIEVELKSVVASVFFSSDVANPDTYAKFYADIQMFQITMTQPDPAQHMRHYHSRDVATKENKWQGRISRAGSTRSTSSRSTRPRTSSIRSSAPRSSSRCNDLLVAGQRVHPGHAPPQGRRQRQHAASGDERLGQRSGQSAGLVPGGVRAGRVQSVLS